MNTIDTTVPCHDPRLQKLCSAYLDTIPHCNAITQRGNLLRERGKVLWGKADCIDLFELRKEALKANCFSFKTVSWCMFPVLKKGDTVKIGYTNAKDITVGDIPVYRAGGRLYAHRIVGKKIMDGKEYIITRPDTAKRTVGNLEYGEAIPEEDLLGRITEVKRGKKTCSPERRNPAAWEKLLYKKAQMQAKTIRFFLKTLDSGLAKFQSFGLYEWVGRKIVKGLKHTINFQLVLPVTSKLEIYEYKSLGKIDISKLDLGKYRNFHILMKFKNTPAGCASFLNRTGNCPHRGRWLSDIYIRLPYRAIGFESILADRAKKFLKKSEIKPVTSPPSS